MTLQTAMDNLRVAKVDLDDNPNDQQIINAYNQAIDDYKTIRSKSI